MEVVCVLMDLVVSEKLSSSWPTRGNNGWHLNNVMFSFSFSFSFQGTLGSYRCEFDRLGSFEFVQGSENDGCNAFQ